MKAFQVLVLSIFVLPIFGNEVRAFDEGEDVGVTPNLSQKDAKKRSALISKVQYDLSLDLNQGTETFTGRIKTNFELSKNATGLFMDLRSGAEVLKYSVNGNNVLKVEFQKGRLLLPTSFLKEGGNEVWVEYRQKYSKDGSGLYRFVDPEDKRIYMYTQFETVDANHMFPCFDQPDLRAVLKMQVTAPAEWNIITTTRETAVKTLAKTKVWTFPETPRISTYLFSLMAGPYHSWSSRAGDIPLRLFIRQSQKQYVKPQEWFLITQQGLKFYNDYFGYAYPFKKYDQIIVPDFNAGAMENVAAVTFSERYAPRGAMTRENLSDRADVILHEMAHMWFGDLVTMNWWNGLWLNESFATYMSSLAMSLATEFSDSWIGFYDGTKGWAYWTDQLVVTHPIEGDVIDTDAASSIFDGITYGKGASVLKQLAFYLGPDTFRDGLRTYFKKHAYSNTTIHDFLGALEEVSGKDLKKWSKLWLETEGLDSLKASFECVDSKISSFALEMQAPKGQSPKRPHRTQVGLYYAGAQGIELKKKLAVEYSHSKTVVKELVGEACPDMVYPNQDDEDYVKVRLDDKTLQTVKTSLASVKDNFSRMLFYPNLYEMLRDGEMNPATYLQIIEKNLLPEQDLKIVSSLMQALHGYAGDGFSAAFYYLPQSSDEQIAVKAQWVQRFEELLWKKFVQSKSQDLKKLCFDSFVKLSQGNFARNKLSQVIQGNAKLGSFKLDQDQRWNVLIRLSSLGSVESAKWVEIEAHKDKSESGIKAAMAADAAFPNLDIKKKWATRVADDKEMTYSRKRAVMGASFPVWQDALLEKFSEQFYETLLRLAKAGNDDLMSEFAEELAPAYCTENSVKDLERFVNKNGKDLGPSTLKALKIKHQEDERCVNVRKTASSGSKM